MLMKRSMFRRAVAWFMILMMVFTITPYSGKTVLAADTSSSTTYAKEPNWIKLTSGGDSQDKLNVLAAFLRYQKGNPTANEKNECSTYISDFNWDDSFTDDTLYIRLESDITFKTKSYRTDYDHVSNDGAGTNTMFYQTGEWTHNFPVYGNKVLDLNGHKIKVELTSSQVGAPLFKIMDDANLTIVDSQGGGKMIANSDLVDKYFNLFEVYSGGELVLNAPDSEFISGYSKEEWLVDAYKNNEDAAEDNKNNYNGYGRKLANGTAVTVRGGGKLTLAGGTVEGRGFSSISKYGNGEYGHNNSDYKPLERCAAIEALPYSTVHIIDGNVYGMGCADAMHIDKHADITIESGKFDVKKVDKVILPDANQAKTGSITTGNAFVGSLLGPFGYMLGAMLGSGEKENYMDGTYGVLGIPDMVFVDLANDKGRAVEVLCGSEKVTGADVRGIGGYTSRYDHKGESVTIRPKSGDATQDSDRVSITPTSGVYSWVATAAKDNREGLYVDASLKERYFSERARELSDTTYREQGDRIGHRPQEYYLNYKFTLYDEDFDLVGDLGERSYPANMTSISGFDLTAMPKASGSGYAFPMNEWLQLKEGSYYVKCEVTEVWKGEHTYKSAWKAFMPLEIRREVNGLLSELQGQTFDLEITCKDNNYIDKVPTVFVELGRDTESMLRTTYKKLKHTANQYNGKLIVPENGEWTDITVRYRVYDYDPDGNVLIGSDSGSVPEKGSLDARTPGLKVITAELGIPVYGTQRSGVADIVGYDTIVVSKNFLLLPHMSLWDGDSRRDYELKFPNATLTGENQSAVIYLPGEMSEATTNKGTFDWECEFLSGEHDMYMGDEADYVDYAGAIDDDGYLKLTLDGSYVVYCDYAPNKAGAKTVTFESVPIDVTSSMSQPFKVALTASSSDNTFTVNDIENKEANLKLVCQGDLTGIEYVQFSLKGYPSEVGRSHPVIVKKADWNSNQACVIDLSQFDGIAEAIENGIDPYGEYTIRAVVVGKNPYKYSVQAEDLTITVPKNAEGYALVANGRTLGPGYSTAEEAENAAIPLYLDFTNPNVTFSAKYYPDNATYDSKKSGYAEDDIFYNWTVESGASITMGNTFDSETVNATIKQPGTTIIKMWTGISGRENTWTYTYFKVCVPVTEIEFTQPDYQSKIGQYYREVVSTVTAKAACGVSRTDAFDFSYIYNDTETKANYAPVLWNNSMSGGKDRLEKKVAANDKGYINYYFHLEDGQSYPLKKISEDSNGYPTYLMDTSAVKLTIDGVTKTVEDWGISPSESKNGFNTGTLQKANAADFKLEKDVFVKDESAKYIDVITVTTTEPGVGDPINENAKIYWENGSERDSYYDKFKEISVFSLSSVKTKDGKSIIVPYSTQVYKPTSGTAGTPYTDADGAETESGKEAVNLYGKKYETGTYVNEVQLMTNRNVAANGNKYYFSPDCTVILNGHLLDFGDRTTYNIEDGYSTLSFSYFFDVGDVNTVDYLKLSGLMPLQGNTPAESKDVTAIGYDLSNGGTNANEAEVYLKQLKWFVDDNGDGKYDAGEEVKVEWTYTTDEDGKKQISGYDAENSTLWWDGTFLPGVKYSAEVEIGTDDSATRLADNIELDCDGESVILTGGQKKFVVTFDEDKTIRKIHVATAVGAAAANPDNRDPLGVFDASNQGYKVESYYVYKHKDSSDSMSSDRNISNFYDSTDLSEKTLENGKYWMLLSFQNKDGYKFADKVNVLINGVDYGEFGYGTEQVKDIYVAAQTSYVNAWRTFEVGDSSAGGEEVLLGDVNGDGKVTAADLTMLAQHVARIDIITDEKALSCADVTKDDNVTAADLTKLAQYVARIITSFD